MAEDGAIDVTAAAGVADVGAEDWDRLASGAPPVVEHAFLASLEEAGCVGAGTGWTPVPLVARSGGRVVGAAPAYLKTHSMGEFVYDWAWADAAARAGVAYYPKLVLAAPFSPVAGPRLLTSPDLSAAERDRVRRALLSAAADLARDRGAHGLHLLFPTEAERDLAVSSGLFRRMALQFHWQNEGYADFEGFLARFRSRRRKEIRRERRLVRDAGVEVRSFTGGEIEDSFRDPAWRFYTSTVDRHVYGRRYLNPRFFELLWARFRHRLQMTLAFRDGAAVGGTLNLEKDRRRYGRYWGAGDEVPYLHFEVCAYAAIEDCIARGVEVFEAGAGGGDHKYGRGFLPVPTWSAHVHAHPGLHAALAAFARREEERLVVEARALRDGLFVR